MVWDFAEANILGESVGGWVTCSDYVADCIQVMTDGSCIQGHARQIDAAAGADVALCLRHTNGEDLPLRLEKIGQSLRDQGELDLEHFGSVTTFLSLICMALLCGMIIVAMFAPLIELYRHFTFCG